MIARGAKLVDDVSAAEGAQPGLAARLAMAAFDPLFRLNVSRSPRGWQTIGLATVPPDPVGR